MSNIVLLRHQRALRATHSSTSLLELFAHRRRGRNDAYWMKENAEILQILAATQNSIAEGALETYVPFADGIAEELRFFPQYYRMLLSMALDLDALGMPDIPIEHLADAVRTMRLIEGELSDMLRAEALLLLRRSGDETAVDPGLDERLHRFARNSSYFCLPNRRAAYDLTHIVFHASDYGRKSMACDADLRKSLIHVGMVAWLEDNPDLLAEVAISLRLLNQPVPALWDKAVSLGAARVEFDAGDDQATLDDGYHQYLVLNWAEAAAGRASFSHTVPAHARLVLQPKRDPVALTELSLLLIDSGSQRISDWPKMKWRIWSSLSADAKARIAALEGMPEFEGFFEGFSRCTWGRK